MGVKLVESIEL